MRILDRYIMKSVIKMFLGCVIAFVFLYVIIDIFGHLDEILKQKVTLLILKQYYLYYIPIILVQITPIACLLATLYTFGGLSRHNEIIAMRTSGLDILQISGGVIVFSILVSVFVFLINEKIVPQSLNMVDKIKAQMEQKYTMNEEKEVVRNLSMYGLKNRLFFVNKFSVANNTMEDITILEEDRYRNVTKMIVAKKGIWEDGVWTFYQSLINNFDENGQIKGETQYLEEHIIDIAESPRDFLKQKRNPEAMNVIELLEYIQKVSKSGAEAIVRNLKVNLYHRLVFPFTSLVITVVGIPFALRIRGRATALASFGISFTLGFLYYVSDAISIAIGRGGFLPPLIATSLGHIVFLSLGLYLIFNLP